MKTSRLLFLATFAALFVGGAAALFAQGQQPAGAPAKPAKEAAPVVHKQTLVDKFKQGGFVMYPILMCSIGMLYLLVDGVLRTTRSRVIPPQQLHMVQSAFRQGDYVGAYNQLRAQKSPFSNVARVGISMLGEGKTAVEEAVIQELQKEASHMNHYISYLSVIGVCTPMIGLIGTVSGMIAAFDTLGTSGIGDPSALSHAIGEVLVATFSGLLIAVPAFAFYYFLRNRSAKAIHDIQDAINMLFRKMPYDQLTGAHIGGEEIYANTPNWVANSDAVAAEINA
jgi:biopolymer transport protein ExbB